MLKVAIPPPPTGLPRFERLFEKKGWAQSSFHCAIQDRTRFLWFCTADGLLRYDGYSLKAFRYDPTRDDSLASKYRLCDYGGPARVAFVVAGLA